MKPFIGRRAIIPRSMLTDDDLTRMRKKLRFESYSIDAITSLINFEDENTLLEETDDEVSYDPHGTKKEIDELRFHDIAKAVSVPRHWAITNLPHIKFVDRTTSGSCAVKHKHPIKPRDQQQKQFFDSLRALVTSPGHQEILANATTGAGKSVAICWLGLETGTRTLILVDTNKLKKQYMKLLQQFMGPRWVDEHVGVVQQDECDFKGRDIVIGMVPSISHRKYPAAFYDHFGLIAYDEVQIFGSQGFSSILSMFSAKNLLGLTATNKTGDFGRLIKTHLGNPKIISKQEVMKPSVKIIHNKIGRLFRCGSDGEILTSLARLTERNEKIAKIVKKFGIDRNRVCLVLSDRIEQLQTIRNLLCSYGVPYDDIGLHVGKFTTHRFCVYYQYGVGAKRQWLATCESYNEARNLYNRLQRTPTADLKTVLPNDAPVALLKALDKGKSVMFSTAREQYAPTEIELDNITNSCNIILATYKIFAKGVDVPRIDFGFEALPVGDPTQPLGRVLRIHKGKSTPEWGSIHDRVEIEGASSHQEQVIYALNAWFDAKANRRLTAFQKSGATIKEV